jgi:GNAT superfamily N-acetyltransferase
MRALSLVCVEFFYHGNIMNWSDDKNFLLEKAVLPEAASADAVMGLLELEECLGCAGLWWSDVPAYPGETIGCIGAFGASSAEVCEKLLERAEKMLREHGATIVIGPMNGNTWRKHRWVAESNGRPPFALEPTNDHPEQPLWWQKAGYAVLSQYSSSVVPLDGSQVTNERVRGRLQAHGVVLQTIDLDVFEEELRDIYELSVRSFSQNFLYTPMSWEQFFSQYQSVRAGIDPLYVIIARCAGEAVGFVFGIPDFLAQREGRKAALIVKTLAAKAERAYAGLGNWLVDECHRRAYEAGYREAIHALQFDDNTSRKITERFGGVVFRRYALMSKTIR